MRSKFLIFLFLFFLVFSLSEAYFLAYFFKNQYFDNLKKNLSSRFIDLTLKYFPLNNFEDYKNPEIIKNFEDLFFALKTPEIKNIIFYLSDGAVAYSDNKILIGQKFSEIILSDYYSEAALGKVVLKINPKMSSANIYLPLHLENKFRGFFEVNFSFENFNELIFAIQLAIYFSFISFFLILGIFVFWFFKKNVENSIFAAVNRIKEIKGENFAHDLKFKEPAEFNPLFESINSLAKEIIEAKNRFESEIKDKNQELKKMKFDFENKLKENKENLESEIERLVQFRDLAMSREEKILELKNEIKRLKEILGEE